MVRGHTGTAQEDNLLYFAYTARIAPQRMAEVCPNASFEFIAHLPEWGLDFPIAGTGWGGGRRSSGSDPHARGSGIGWCRLTWRSVVIGPEIGRDGSAR